MDSYYIISFLKMLFALSLVLGIMLGAVYLLRKLGKQGQMGFAPGGSINVITVRYLDPKTAIMVVDVFNRIYVLGVSGNNITLIDEITDSETISKLKQAKNYETQYASKTPKLSSFSFQLWISDLRRRLVGQ
ncbi:MAG: flagellar biosynthetic protein FliO [Syntrophales bacterium]|nr:flagellar biosynthetic protein FliO [Syntrophales bacterium]